MQDIQHKLAVARGESAADLVFRNCRIINVLSGEIHEGDVAVSGGRIVGIGRYDGKHVVDLNGSFLAPSFLDGHIHLESTMLTLPEFARAVAPRGTGGAVVDPHEFANVVGLPGIEYVLDAAREVPLDLFVMMSSCVPATPFETSGARLGRDDMYVFIHRDKVAGVAEMMNFPAVYNGDEAELGKIALARHGMVDGHAPGLTGRNLDAYVLAGVRSDHECTTVGEAREKLRRGMHILLREGTAERNLHDLLPLVTAANAANFSFATDDKHPADLEDEGHIDHHVREAVRFGIDPMLVMQMATINTARHYGLRNLGAIAPRFHANLVVFDTLDDVRPRMVWHHGELVARDGAYLRRTEPPLPPAAMTSTMHVHDFVLPDLQVPAAPDRAMRVIDIVPRQIVTRQGVETPLVVGGCAVSDTARDILKLVVIERHRATGNIGRGFVRGFGLVRGALASTVAHDAHNIIIVGTNDLDMYVAALELIRLDGGQCVVENGRVVEELALPIAGLVSDRPLPEVRARVDALISAAAGLGCVLPDPFMTLSFLALSPIPSLKVTDLGLFDAERFEITDLFV